jgi:hypothetical protein
MMRRAPVARDQPPAEEARREHRHRMRLDDRCAGSAAKPQAIISSGVEVMTRFIVP